MSNRVHRILGVHYFFMFYIMLYMFFIMLTDICQRSSLHRILGVDCFFVFSFQSKSFLMSTGMHPHGFVGQMETFRIDGMGSRAQMLCCCFF
jgi:hypothetical protein